MKLLLELSMRASVMACAVLAARICFKRLPKGMFYVLWILVFMRAALVFSFPAKISIWNADFFRNSRESSAVQESTFPESTIRLAALDCRKERTMETGSRISAGGGMDGRGTAFDLLRTDCI